MDVCCQPGSLPKCICFLAKGVTKPFKADKERDSRKINTALLCNVGTYCLLPLLCVVGTNKKHVHVQEEIVSVPVSGIMEIP